MGLDPNVVDKLLDLTRRTFPGWSGFTDPEFLVEERNYKVKTMELAVGSEGLLLEEALRADLEGQAFPSFLNRFIKVGKESNLLFLHIPSSSDLLTLYDAYNGVGTDQKELCEALLDLVWGSSASPERLQRFVDFCKARNLHCPWPLPTYFLFFTHPDTEMFVKPQLYRRVAKALGTPWSAKGGPNAADYGLLKEWSQKVLQETAAMGAQDMIDVQSLIWVAGNAMTQPPPNARCWKIAPGKQAWNWDACREGGLIAVGWDEFGDVGSMTHDEFLAAQAAEVGAHDDWTTQGSDQVWRFAHEIAVGDLIVANRGKSEVLGFGRVTGPYQYHDGTRHAHHLPVEWFDTNLRRLDEPRHDWMRTLLRLERVDYERLLALPPASDSVQLGTPFDQLFADAAEGEAVLALMGDALAGLGVESNGDKRFAATYSPSQRKLSLYYGPWCVVRWWSPSRTPRLQLALPENDPATAPLPIDFRYKEAEGERPIVLCSLDLEAVGPEVRVQFLDALHATNDLFGHRQSSNWRSYHIDGIGGALLDPAERSNLLTRGLAQEVIEPAENAAFSADARDLLVEMAEQPTREFYNTHRDELARLVQNPMRSLLLAVSDAVEPALRDALETQKRLFSIFPKNDFGRGGAWPYYWGAFYPVGGKKTQGCQLYAFVDATGLAYGFSIGDYASEDRKRFARNVQDNREALKGALGDKINAPDFGFGDRYEGQGTHVTQSMEELDLSSWLDSVAETGPHAHVIVSWRELLAKEREQLVQDVAIAFNRLFPLVLLSTLDDPMPAIQDYLETAGKITTDVEDLNPAYSLADLAAETSLPGGEPRELAARHRAQGPGDPVRAARHRQDLRGRAARQAPGRPAATGIVGARAVPPAYAYEDFIQGIRPKARDDGGLDYPIVRRPLHSSSASRRAGDARASACSSSTRSTAPTSRGSSAS